MSDVSVPVSVLVFDVDGTVTAHQWNPDSESGLLRYLQETVGGLVDVVALDAAVDMWVNDEGLLTEQVNPVASLVAGSVKRADLQPFYGRAVFTGGADEQGITTGLSVLWAALLQHLAAMVGEDHNAQAEVTLRGDEFAALHR